MAAKCCERDRDGDGNCDRHQQGRPRRIQRQRTKGWRMPANTVYVGRPTKWGNPYRVELFGTAERAIAQYRLIFTKACVTNQTALDLRADLKELRGKNLACWCPVGRPCHADVLLELANR